MAGISISGIGSGLDINSLVTQLVAAEAQPATNRLNRREAGLQAVLSGIGTFKSALSEFRSAAAALSNPAKFEGMKASTSGDGVFTANAGSLAQPGKYSVEVLQLATAQRLATPAASAFSAITDSVGHGTLTIRFGLYDATATTFTANPEFAAKTVTIEPSNGTLEGIRDAINEADIGLRASIVNDGTGYRLVLGPLATGAGNAVEISVDDGDGGNTDSSGLSLLAYQPTTKNLVETVAAEDARVVIDGLAITSPGNTLSEAVQGVTLELVKTAPGETTELSVARDTAAINGAVQAFVDAYNALVEVSESLTTYNPETGARGALLGDAAVRGMTGQLRRHLGDSVAGAPDALRTLSDVGISIQRDGKLEFDSAKLQAAIAADPQAVASLFAGTESDEGAEVPPATGIAERLNEYLTSMLKTSGPLNSRTASLTERIADIDDARESLARRLDSLETRLRNQFTAMDALVSQLAATGSFLTQQLAGLSTSDG